MVVDQPVRRRRGAPTDEETVASSAARGVEGYRGDTARALADVKGWLGDGWRVVLVTEGHGPAQRMVEVLGGEDVPARLDESLADVPGARRRARRPAPASAAASSATTLRLAVLTETDLIGPGRARRTKDMRRMPSRRRNTVDPLQLQAGDYVVHEQHGVGRYVEMVQRTVQGATREYLVIEYAPTKRGQPGDRLFVPTDQLDQVTRYVGGEAPTLHRLGGADWPKTKGRARKAVKEIAAELIRLYAARTSAPGLRVRPGHPVAARARGRLPVRRDARPARRDRRGQGATWRSRSRWTGSICGDVGYGKTEIAVRAAFKAVQDGKQVAVLVPTTLLVQQHLSTFAERYASFPVNVAALSRFQTDKEAERGQGGPRSTARSTSSSAPTGCSRPRCSSRTSAWSSSTRSSASASSTRSSSSSCAPTSTC